eukprot:7389687-Prymnesium_polylepis.2
MMLRTSKRPARTVHSISKAGVSTASGCRNRTPCSAAPDLAAARAISRYPAPGKMIRPCTM